MFGIGKLKREIEKLKKEVDEEKEKTTTALKQMFLFNHKPKYKQGQNVWFYHYRGFGDYSTLNGFIVMGHAEKTYSGAIAYFYKCVDMNGREYEINEQSVYKTKPSC